METSSVGSAPEPVDRDRHRVVELALRPSVTTVFRGEMVELEVYLF